MANNRLSLPIISALSIQEEYHKDVEAHLKSYNLDDETQTKIITDTFGKDDIYFSLNRSYEHIQESFRDFCKSKELHYALPDMFPSFADPTKGQYIYAHQSIAIENILNEKTTIISTGICSVLEKENVMIYKYVIT